MINKKFEEIKKQYAHAFNVDDNGKLTLKKHFGIPVFKLIYVEGGKFIMGDNNSNYEEQKPEHNVETSSFFLAEFPVTQEIYKIVLGKERIKFKGVNHPVEYITWNNAVEFCHLLNQKINITKICDKDYNFLDSNGKKTKSITDVKGFRLPTEAEWEFAARGGIFKKK